MARTGFGGRRGRATVAVLAAGALFLTGCGGTDVSVRGAAVRAGGAAGCGSGTDGDAIVGFRAPSGACVPTDRLLLYGCDPAIPPLILRGLGDPSQVRRYAGGRYAVRVDKLPAGANPLGSADGLQVLTVPGDPHIVLARHDDTIERWLPLPREIRGTQPSALFIGDSITLGAEPWIIGALPGWATSFDAVIGRSSSSGPSIALTGVASSPDVVVVELGTNDADPTVFGENLRETLDALDGVPLVVWQTVHSPSEVTSDLNIAIRQEVAEHANAVVADWDAFASDDVLGSDGVHPLPGHEDEMAKLIGPFLVHWLAAVGQTAATACDHDGDPT
jgi:hypothetical protein